MGLKAALYLRGVWIDIVFFMPLGYLCPDFYYQGTSNPDGYISTLPGSSVVFHWPRNDYDQLLCVRLMDVPNCIWSGGFEVNKNNSFHINMR